MEYWVKCPVCHESNLLGEGNFQFINRIGYTNVIKILLPTCCRICKNMITIEELEVRSKNPKINKNNA